MKSIKAEFLLNVECNKNKTGHSDSQVRDVDERIALVLFNNIDTVSRKWLRISQDWLRRLILREKKFCHTCGTWE